VSDGLDAALDAALEAGEAVALAEVVDGAGAGAGARLLVWARGESLGDLGSPRLNQRVALYAEGLLARGGSERKHFDVPGGAVDIETTVYRPGEPRA
jgi:xanthine/CO dehydrogenase XdhC/CoxF family maturation factor